MLNRDMRWEVADLLRERYVDDVNEEGPPLSPPSTFYLRCGKRFLDVIGAGIALTVTLPLNIVIAGVTLAGLGKPLFFRQSRLGKDGELFTLVKFRNMREAFDENGHPLPGSQRVTRLGKVMRRTSFDELLNFWSVLKGDMSLIGPRPLVPEYYDRFSTRHRSRLAVKPGLECPPISSSTKAEGYYYQFENDVWYVENVSMRTDLRLMLRLVQSVLDRKQSKIRSSASRGSFMGYGPDGQVLDSYHVPIDILDAVLLKHNLISQNSILNNSRPADT